MPTQLRSVILALALSIPAVANAQVPSPPDTLSPERMKAHLAYQWRVLLITSILNARELGQNPTDFGRSTARWISQRWGSDLHPQQLGRDLEVRYRRLGFATQVMEDADTAFTFYWSAVPDSAAFYRTYGAWGIRVADIEDFITGAGTSISNYSNVVWTASRNGNWRVARITRKP